MLWRYQHKQGFMMMPELPELPDWKHTFHTLGYLFFITDGPEDGFGI